MPQLPKAVDEILRASVQQRRFENHASAGYTATDYAFLGGREENIAFLKSLGLASLSTGGI